MSNIQIKDLPSQTSISGSDIVHVNDAGTNSDKSVTLDNFSQGVISTSKANNTEAIAGTSDSKIMTPEKTKLFIDELLTSGVLDDTEGAIPVIRSLGGVFGLGGTNAALPPNNNLNDITRTGFYKVDGSTSNTPVSDSGSTVISVHYDATNAQQIFLTHNTSKLFSRSQQGSAWGTWSEALTESSLETGQQRFSTSGDDLSGNSSEGFSHEVFNSDSSYDAFMRFLVNSIHGLHFGLDADRKRLMVGGYSEGTGNKRDMLTRQTFHYGSLTTEVEVDHRTHGNDALIQLESVDGGRIKILDNNYWQQGDSITIINGNPVGNLLIQNEGGQIYISKNGASVSAGVDLVLTVVGSLRLVRHTSGVNWILSKIG